MKRYRWVITGTAADGQTWSTSGEIECEPRDFPSLPRRVFGESFQQLTQGKAVFGRPGVGCNGPYDIQSLVLSESPASQAVNGALGRHQGVPG